VEQAGGRKEVVRIERLIREEIIGQRAYDVEDVSCPVKLDANESPYGVPAELASDLMERLAAVPLNRYPEAGSMRLRERYAAFFGVPPEGLIIGNGSDELIALLCAALATPGSSVVVPAPTFVMYRIIAQNSGQRVIEVPLGPDHDLGEAFLAAVVSKRPALVFLSYPNNPTGNCFDRDRIIEIIEAAEGLVVVDEAYFPFCGKTFIPLLGRYENLVILRTLSKLGLAAARVGFLMGSPLLVRELDKVRLPYNVNALSQVVAAFYLDHEAAFREGARAVVAARGEVFGALAQTKGVRPFPSEANFIFFTCDFYTHGLYRRLIEGGVLVRSFHAVPSLRNAMRVTIGSPQENRRFIDAFQGELNP